MAKQNASNTKKKSGWPVIADIIKNENGSYVKFKEGVKITLNGEEVPLNEKRTAILQDPVKEVERMVANGVISEDKAEARLAQVQEVATWLKYSICCPPPKET